MSMKNREGIKMSFCPLCQDKECSSNCAIWDKDTLSCSFSRIPKEISKLVEELIKCEEAI